MVTVLLRNNFRIYQFSDSAGQRFHIHFKIRSQLSNPAHLLMAMLMDFGLHRPSGNRGTTGLPLHYLRTFYSEPQMPRQRTLEERRTYIGCYHLLTT
jgi:hypothetical protein